jgi:hypothetical protein
MGFSKLHQVLRSGYKKYKQYINFNKNLLIAEMTSLFTGAVAAQSILLLTDDPIINSVTSLAGDYAGSYSTFIILHYYDNLRHYKNSKWKLLKDIFKIAPFLASGEIVYIFSKGTLHYLFLTSFNQIPFIASIFSDLIATSIFFLLINIGARVTGFIRKK